jgi:hypothetical protein
MQSDTGMTSNIQEEIYDEVFYVKLTRWKTWKSYRVSDNSPILTSLEKDLCISHTRFYLKGLQEGFVEKDGVTYEGTVGGKL